MNRMFPYSLKTASSLFNASVGGVPRFLSEAKVGEGAETPPNPRAKRVCQLFYICPEDAELQDSFRLKPHDLLLHDNHDWRRS